ncbi:MAG: RagB/SusD family nutrient uptake outer membrane protein [Prevotella sp.]|nr:RagB/SusD family nutrient uptake outer membrane protein [Prevotella sp.]
MKNYILGIICTICLSAAFTSCDDYLDITPKGSTLLDTFDDLQLLASGSYSQSAWSYSDMEILVNDCYGTSTSFMTNLTQTNTIAAALLTYNENIDRASLTESNQAYSMNYSAICRMNVVIQNTPTVAGDESKKASLVAQARVIRAYLHYLVMIPFCKQYDASTAATEGGIPYVTDINLGEENKKLTLQETYDRMLEDCTDEVLNLLPEEPTDIELPGKAFGYAVRAKLLLQMKNYSEALKYANLALRYNDNIEDRRGIVEAPLSFQRSQFSPCNIFYAEPVSSGAGTNYLSYETAALFEDGDILKDYAIYSQSATRTVYVWNPTDIAGLSEPVLNWSVYNTCRYNTGGITSEQMYYIAAECYIRTGNIQSGLDLVNKVRQYRIAPAQYQPLTASNEKDAMTILQRCKRIECLFTYNNYADLKRWNTESAYRQTIRRTLNGTTYSLSPDSPLWVFPFPKNATEYNKSLTQNY